MKMSEYQERVEQYDLFDSANAEVASAAFMAKILGLAGEAGEVCEKFKKILRDKGGKMSEADRAEVAKELGDVLWYVTTIGRYMGVSLSEIAEGNIRKLEGRRLSGRLKGSGDNR